MNKERKINRTIIITIIIVFFILLLSIVVSIALNKQRSLNDLYELKCYQYEVENFNINYKKEPTLLFTIDFNQDTDIDKIIYTNDEENYNHLIIKNGVAYISDATCQNKNCMKSVIRLSSSLINNSSITCMPNGLVIKLELKA